MTTRDTLIAIFNDSALMDGNEPAFLEALEAHEATIRQECSGYPLVPLPEVVKLYAGEDWSARQKRRTSLDSRGKQ